MIKIFCSNLNMSINKAYTCKLSLNITEFFATYKLIKLKFKKAIREKFKAFAEVRASSKESRQLRKIEFYKKCRKVKFLVRKAHIHYERSNFNKCKADPKLLYAYVNEQRGGKSPIGSLVNKNGISLTDGKDIANCLIINIMRHSTETEW
jgi:hypothetical protein